MDDIDGDFDTDGIGDSEGPVETGYEIDADIQAEAEGLLSAIENAQCERWDTEMEALIGQVRNMLEGFEDPADLRSHIDTLTWWLETDVYRPPLPPEQQWRDQYCIRRPCRGCKRVYRRCMQP